MPITHASVTDAHAAQQRGALYVDVRSTEEFLRGHAAGAVNVPLLEPDEDTGVLLPNPDFVRVMKANFPPDPPLLLGCRSGGRSARASWMLEAFGYTNITNIAGGFEGGQDPGWEPSGLPSTTAVSPGETYAELLAAADARQ
jgi:rhodanese-related sulfurtransferase